MPLQKGSSRKTVSNNIRELHTGKTYAHTASKFGKARADKQAVAIALNEARKGRASGGAALSDMTMRGRSIVDKDRSDSTKWSARINAGMQPKGDSYKDQVDFLRQPIEQRAMGGGIASQAFNAVMPGKANGVVPLDVSNVKPLKRGGVAIKPISHSKITTGPLISSVPGRTDMHFTHVPSGSYVIPADIVSGHGEGNTLAGVNTLHKLFKMGPYGSSPGKIPFHGIKKKFAKGGQVDENIGKPTPVKLAGGEIVVPPENVHETMQRLSKEPISLDEAHAAMDRWVVNERKKLRKTLAKLPGPARD